MASYQGSAQGIKGSKRFLLRFYESSLGTVLRVVCKKQCMLALEEGEGVTICSLTPDSCWWALQALQNPAAHVGRRADAAAGHRSAADAHRHAFPSA